MENWIREGDKNEAQAKSDSDREIAKHLNFAVFFIELLGKYPSDELIKRFADLPRTIKKISDAEPDKGPHTPIDKATRRAGIIFSVHSIRWIDNGHAEVEGGYYCGGLRAGGITFAVHLKNGKWVVKSSHMKWIS